VARTERRRRSFIWLALAGVAFCVAGPARASTGGGEVGAQAWAVQTPVTTFAPADGSLYAALTLGQEEARAFVELRLDPTQTYEWEAAQLVMAEAANGALLADQAHVVACVVRHALEGSGQLSDGGPEPDCSVRVDATRHPDGRWTVPLATFASIWERQPRAVLALLGAPDGASPTWRVAWDAAATSLSLAGATVPPPPPAGDEPLSIPIDEPALTSPATDPPLDLTSPGGTGERHAGTVEERDVRRRAIAASAPKEADSPSAAAVIGLLALVAVGAASWTMFRPRSTVAPGDRATTAGSRLAPLGLLALAAPLALREVDVYRAGLVLIVLVGAFGLHVLVNWAGQLSLAHAGMIGVPAFVVIQLSSHHGLSPVYLLPMGVVAGAAVGLVVGLPALRALGLQVALVTLAAGIAINSYLFTRPWLVGPSGGLAAEVPRVGPLELRTARALYPVLVLIVVAAVAALWAIRGSKLGRALLWIRATPDAAAAFGIPVASYKLAAYGVAGAFAGLAGGLMVMWVQRLTPQAFPLPLSFTYLLIVIVAGRGFVGGLAAAALLFKGGELFVHGAGAFITYGGPVVLVLVLTRYKAGLTGLGSNAMEKMGNVVRRLDRGGLRDAPTSSGETRPVRGLLIGGLACISLGLVAIAVAWYHVGNTDQLWIQNQEIVSGGIGGITLVVIGLGLLVLDRIGQVGLMLRDELRRSGAPGRELESEGAPLAPVAVVAAGPSPARPRRRSGTRPKGSVGG
jgi:branched-chain amino acid transport system permease protein